MLFSFSPVSAWGGDGATSLKNQQGGSCEESLQHFCALFVHLEGRFLWIQIRTTMRRDISYFSVIWSTQMTVAFLLGRTRREFDFYPRQLAFSSRGTSQVSPVSWPAWTLVLEELRLADRHNLPPEVLIFFKGFSFWMWKRDIRCLSPLSLSGREKAWKKPPEQKLPNPSFPDLLAAVEIVSNDAGNVSLERSKQTSEN